MSESQGRRLKKLREDKGLSQEDLAKMLQLDRSTLSLIEADKRPLKGEQIITIAKVFNISSDELLGIVPPIEVCLEEHLDQPSLEKTSMRINVPVKNIKKFKEVLLYVLSRVGAKSNVGETVLYKLLYFIDFNFYEKYEEQLMGATYIKNKYGPTPIEFKKIVEQMSQNNELEVVKSEHFQYPQKKYLPRREPDLAVLTAPEIKLIDDVLSKLSNMNASSISEYSHNDVPWVVTAPGKRIDYETVFYRTAPYSVREYSDEDLQ